ncbi:MAG: nitrate/nitrite transporter NrtS [Congregibacter sp.]
MALAVSRSVVTRSLRVALIVGTLLALINHHEKILSLSLSSTDLLKIMLTYLVPYAVSTWAAVGALQDN